MAQMARVRMVTTGWGGAPGLSTFYFVRGEGPGGDFDAPTADECASRVQVAHGLQAALWPAAWTGTVQTDVDILEPATGELIWTYSVTPGGPIPGSAAGGFGPQAAMIALRYSTGGIVNGHRVRGRSFVGPVSLAGDTDGTPTAAQVNHVNQIGVQLLTLGAFDAGLVVWSRPVDAEHATPTNPVRDGSWHTVTAASARDQFAILRSRRA